MSKEEPAWRAELRKMIWDFVPHEDLYVDQWIDAMAPHIRAAEQRGFQAGVNKTGDSVGKLREQLKTARETVLNSFVCGVCGHRVGWVDWPTGGWWSHEIHPSDDHDAEGCVPDSEYQ